MWFFSSEYFELISEEKSDRDKAIEWWNSFNGKLKQINLIIKHLPERPKSLKLDNITGREIEQIWRREMQQEKKELLQVDFGRVYTTSLWIKNQLKDKNSKLFQMATHQEIENISLFFELLSKSSTFAHKAHKELNKLTK